MHAYDFILILFSFVYAAAVTHVLSTAGEIIIASKRVRLSWFNAGWMCVGLLFTCAWWIAIVGTCTRMLAPYVNRSSRLQIVSYRTIRQAGIPVPMPTRLFRFELTSLADLL
jgi:hypothetical protein